MKRIEQDTREARHAESLDTIESNRQHDRTVRRSIDPLGPDDAPILMELAIAYARDREYTGWDYYDGMSSRILHAVPVENRWLNIAVQESIKRAPLNLRRLFLVKQRQNFKGSALFALANAAAYEYTGLERYATDARALADWLVTNQSDRFVGFCGGHRHPMQQLRERRPANTPNIVTTAYAVRALLRVGTFDPEFARIAKTADTFVSEALDYRETTHGATIKYHPLEDGSYETINGTALGARLYTDLYAVFGEERFKIRAKKLLDHVVAHQTTRGGWTYRIPASASHLSMDNHHNGFILESLCRYRSVTGSDRHRASIKRSRSFYREELFEPNGAPNWDESSRFPKDIHAATQGIITFAGDRDPTFARGILRWVLDQLYAGMGQFYYQRRRFYTKRFTLMRWCQAWMAYALSYLVVGEPALPSFSESDSAGSDEFAST